MKIPGAVIGDIVGSKYEFHNHRSKEFKFIDADNFFTDDSVMTVAVAHVLTEYGESDDAELTEATVRLMCEYGRRFPHAGWGSMFSYWLNVRPVPYGSYGNGAAMRISPVGWYARSEEEVRRLSRIITCVSHNHPEGIKGAECTAMAVFDARMGKSKEEILERVSEYYPGISCLSCDELRKHYDFDVTCQGSLPPAMVCFSEGVSFEDTVRNVISIGGDSDTLAAIAGAVADVYYGIPESVTAEAAKLIPSDFISVMDRFFEKVC